MSRSQYSEDLEQQEHAMWRGAVASAIRGKRGQRLLAEMGSALDAMKEKRLVADALVTEDGQVCALGAVGVARGLDMADLHPHDREAVALRFGIADALAAELAYINDEAAPYDPADRWVYVRAWVAKQTESVAG